MKTTLYYGPWQCRREFMNDCQKQCDREGHALKGCMWLADFKFDWEGRLVLLPVPVRAGSRYGIYHCCCDYPELSKDEIETQRDKWDDFRNSFREGWSKKFGQWPFEHGENWPGHHVRDLKRGGNPVDRNNIIPAQPGVHKVYTKAYPACYGGQSPWNTVGPDLALYGQLTMATPMSRLLEEVSRAHFPYPPATPEEIEEFERRVGWRLDPELRAFYLHCNGSELFKQRPGCPYRLLPLSEIIRARVAIYDEDDDQWGPASVYALCYVQDGDYVVVDVDRQENGRYPLVDGWHEAWPDPKQCGQVANSFSEFLEAALRSQGRQFWLKRAAGR